MTDHIRKYAILCGLVVWTVIFYGLVVWTVIGMFTVGGRTASTGGEYARVLR